MVKLEPWDEALNPDFGLNPISFTQETPWDRPFTSNYTNTRSDPSGSDPQCTSFIRTFADNVTISLYWLENQALRMR
ncbi:hypothetical protein M407DRAFT_152112 [Tulasnella calospora MUT 4182]|uniref:Uncharacterized protein n=1 Tax=Tulasnella calospora MUT 4182 TaxID=1051891 RepID=A0A0C3QRQ3_9AGAM|nr:hypothetical protein M407DRAFT_152112 [Tulasnella calospora MUT 4182]